VKNYINIKDLSFAYRGGQKALSNINLLEKHGIRPSQVAKLFSEKAIIPCWKY